MNRREFFKTTGTAIIGTTICSTDLFAEKNIEPIVHNHAIDWINANIKIKIPYNTNFEKIRLNPIQEKYIKLLQNPTSDISKLYVGRQEGLTTATAAYVLYKMINEKCRYNAWIISASDRQRCRMRDLVMKMYDNLPEKEKQSIYVSFNKTNAEFIYNEPYGKNKVFFRTPTERSCSYTYDLVLLEDYEYYDVDKSIVNDCLKNIKYSLSTHGSCVAYTYPNPSSTTFN